VKLIKNRMLISKDIEAIVRESAIESGIPESWVGATVEVCALNEVELRDGRIESQVLIQNEDGDTRLILEEDLGFKLQPFESLRDEINQFIEKNQ